jgi:hypothetical protein
MFDVMAWKGKAKWKAEMEEGRKKSVIHGCTKIDPSIMLTDITV